MTSICVLKDVWLGILWTEQSLNRVFQELFFSGPRILCLALIFVRLGQLRVKTAPNFCFIQPLLVHVVEACLRFNLSSKMHLLQIQKCKSCSTPICCLHECYPTASHGLVVCLLYDRTEDISIVWRICSFAKNIFIFFLLYFSFVLLLSLCDPEVLSLFAYSVNVHTFGTLQAHPPTCTSFFHQSSPLSSALINSHFLTNTNSYFSFHSSHKELTILFTHTHFLCLTASLETLCCCSCYLFDWPGVSSSWEVKGQRFFGLSELRAHCWRLRSVYRISQLPSLQGW